MTRDEIKYLALQELGYTKEPDFDADDDNAVNAVNGQYEHLYDLALVSFDWCFAYAFIELTGTATNNERYAYSFELPDDLLYLRGVYSDDRGSVVLDYQNINGKLYANASTIYIGYTKKVCEGSLPPHFVEYLKYKIAAKVCQTLTGDMDLLKLMMMREQESFAEAKNIDINQRPVRYLNANAFINVRF